jgi:hypothetical protein
MLGRKKNCPYCKNVIYVRTRPGDRKKVIVTSKDATEIDHQWSTEQEEYEIQMAYQEVKEEFDELKALLSNKYGREPFDNDLFWSIYNKHSLDHMQKANWGHYRNIQLRMGQLLLREKKLQLAFEAFVAVSYLDANGPRNLGNWDLIDRFPPFVPESACQAPAVILYITDLVESLKLKKDEIRSEYIRISKKFQINMQLPLSPEDAWETGVNP